MIDITESLQSLRAHDFKTFSTLAAIVATAYQVENMKPIDADNLQDGLIYLLVTSDFSKEQDFVHLALLSKLLQEEPLYMSGEINFKLYQLLGAMLTAMAIKMSETHFDIKVTFKDLEDEVARFSQQIQAANEHHMVTLSAALEMDEVDELLKPYRLRHELERLVRSQKTVPTELSPIFDVLQKILDAHERITPYLALYLLKSYQRLLIQLKSREEEESSLKKTFFGSKKKKTSVEMIQLASVFSPEVLLKLNNMAQTREAFAEGLSYQALVEKYQPLLTAASGNSKLCNSDMICYRDLQIIRFFVPAIELVSAERCAGECQEVLDEALSL